MKYIAIIIFTIGFTVQMQASELGNRYIDLGHKINLNPNIDTNKIAALWDLLGQAEYTLEYGKRRSGFICASGYVYGPDDLEKWTGDKNACNNKNKVVISRNFACVTGTLYIIDGREKRTFDSRACGNINKIKIGFSYACAAGYIYGPNGFEKWTGRRNGCASVILD